MKKIFIIAWRNLWRNKKRTLITISSVFFALLLVVVMRSFQIGSYENMINSMTRMYAGHLQIYSKGYLDNRTLDNTIVHNSATYEKIASLSEVKDVIPRLESFALVSNNDRTRPVMVLGTDPEREEKLTDYSRHIVEGRFITADDRGVVIGKKLASQLRVSSGDTLVFLGQGHMGISAAGLFEVVGIADIPMPDLNSRIVLMPLKIAQEFYIAEDRLTSYIVLLDNINRTDAIIPILSELLGEGYEIEAWHEILIELVQQIQADNVGGLMTMGLLYVIVGFGIFGTILMMTKERMREFGVMIAVGMKRSKMAIMVIIESTIIGIIGVVAGFMASLPVLTYFHINPITFSGDMAEAMKSMGWEPVLPVSFSPEVFTIHILVIFIITMLVSIYPVMVLQKIKPIEAMKG